MRRSDAEGAPQYRTLADRHVATGERLVQAQRSIILRLKKAGRDTAEAERLLWTLLHSLSLARQQATLLNARGRLQHRIDVLAAGEDTDSWLGKLASWCDSQAGAGNWSFHEKSGGGETFIRFSFASATVSGRFARHCMSSRSDLFMILQSPSAPPD